MSTPAPTQILDLIENRLKNITETNGYNQTVKKFKRGMLQPLQHGDLPGINYYYIEDAWLASLQTGEEERTLNVVIENYNTTRDDNFIDSSNLLAMDVTTALHRDPSAPRVSDRISRLLGKKVIRMVVESVSPAIGEGQKPYYGVVLGVSIVYKINKNDPFTLLEY